MQTSRIYQLHYTVMPQFHWPPTYWSSDTMEKMCDCHYAVDAFYYPWKITCPSWKPPLIKEAFIMKFYNHTTSFFKILFMLRKKRMIFKRNRNWQKNWNQRHTKSFKCPEIDYQSTIQKGSQKLIFIGNVLGFFSLSLYFYKEWRFWYLTHRLKFLPRLLKYFNVLRCDLIFYG